MMDGPRRFLVVSGCRSGRGPIKGAANEARFCPDHFAGDFECPSIVPVGEQRHNQAVVTPEVDDIMRSEPDRLVGLVHRLAYLPAQGVEFRNISVATWI